MLDLKTYFYDHGEGMEETLLPKYWLKHRLGLADLNAGDINHWSWDSHPS